MIQDDAGSQNLLRSTDNGSSWGVLVSNPYSQFTCFAFPSGGAFLGGSVAGVRKSTNGGVAWQLVGVPSSRTTVFGLCADSTGNVFAACGSIWLGEIAEIFKTSDNGQQWATLVSDPGISAFVGIASDASGHVFAASWGGGMYVSSIGGTVWTQSNNGLTDLNLNCVACDHSGMVYAGTGSGVFRSSDNGQHWTMMNEGLSGLGIRVIATSRTGTIYVGTDFGVICASIDHGLHWQTRSNGLKGAQVLSMTVNSQGYVFADQDGWGVYRSTNEGNSWVSVGPNLYGPLLSMTTNRLDHVFAAAGNGLFRTTNNGDAWTLYNSSPDWRVDALALKSDGILFAAPDGEAVCRTLNSTTSVTGPPKNTICDLSLDQNYPNPFNPSTTIRYALPSRAHTSLSVYNTLGQQVAILVDENQEPGYHDVRFDGNDLASGVYFYRLQAGTYVETKKLLLVR